jgi:hypothetical protein
MIAVAQRRLGARAQLVEGDALVYEPSSPVAATTIFRSLHFVRDRVAFFRHVAGHTEKKLIFDVSPRRESVALLRAQLAEAGWPRVEVRPFFAPQHARLPAPLASALVAAERAPVLSGLLLRVRFAVLLAAHRGANA